MLAVLAWVCGVGLGLVLALGLVRPVVLLLLPPPPCRPRRRAASLPFVSGRLRAGARPRRRRVGSWRA